MSPGADPAICVLVTGAAFGAAGAAGAAAGAAAGGAATGSAASSSFWNSQNVMVWGTPFSVTVKSLAVSPSTMLPLLSFTLTISTTSCVLDVNFGMFAAAGAGCCCAG